MADNDYNELDELDDIEKQGASPSEFTLSNVYNIKIGGFGAPESIKTYLCTVKVEELATDIAFYETLTKDKSWPVSQIIQREVDRIRVSNIAKTYIQSEGRSIRYFPPIIIALLPKGPDGKIDLKLNYTIDNSSQTKESIYERSVYRTNEKIKKYFLAAKNKSLVDGLYVLEVSKVFDFNLLCWDQSKYYAIVIDGQHRLAALIKSKKESPEIAKYTQDVVFMDFSTLLNKEGNKHTPVEVVRRVFIDINTNAKKVGIVRQILMDDKDLASLFVQSMVEAVNKDGSDKASDSYLISQIVDWYGESLKHTLPHITGILSLYQIMDDYLIEGNLSSIKDLRSLNKVEYWVSRMNDIFLVDKKIKEIDKYNGLKEHTLEKALEKYTDRIADNKLYDDITADENKETEVFSFNYSVLDVAQETFEERFLRPLTKVFNQLIPYSKTIELITKEKGLEHESLLSVALVSSRNKLEKDKALREKLAELRKKLESELYTKYYHIYTVLGQKVIFKLLFQRIFLEYHSDTNEQDIMKIVDKFISDINRLLEIVSVSEIRLFGKKEQVTLEGLEDDLIDLGTIATSFWEGIIYEDNKIIYNTQGIRSLSALLHYLLVRIDDMLAGRERSVDFIISYMPDRTRRILRKKDENLSESDIANHATQIIEAKERFIENYLTTNYKAWFIEQKKK